MTFLKTMGRPTTRKEMRGAWAKKEVRIEERARVVDKIWIEDSNTVMAMNPPETVSAIITSSPTLEVGIGHKHVQTEIDIDSWFTFAIL